MTPILTLLAGLVLGAAAMAVVIFEWAAKPDCYEEEG